MGVVVAAMGWEWYGSGSSCYGMGMVVAGSSCYGMGVVWEWYGSGSSCNGMGVGWEW